MESIEFLTPSGQTFALPKFYLRFIHNRSRFIDREGIPFCRGREHLNLSPSWKEALFALRLLELFDAEIDDQLLDYYDTDRKRIISVAIFQYLITNHGWQIRKEAGSDIRNNWDFHRSCWESGRYLGTRSLEVMPLERLLHSNKITYHNGRDERAGYEYLPDNNLHRRDYDCANSFVDLLASPIGVKLTNDCLAEIEAFSKYSATKFAA